MSDKYKVQYLGTNIGKIYLADVGKRQGLGGSPEGNYSGGQDQYIAWGETVILDGTSEVINSAASGTIKYYSTENVAVFPTGAPFTVTTSSAFTQLNEIPLRDVQGATGRFTAEYIEKLSDAKFGATGILGVTGYFYGNR